MLNISCQSCFLSAPQPSRASVVLEYSLTTLATCTDAAGFCSQLQVSVARGHSDPLKVRPGEENWIFAPPLPFICSALPLSPCITPAFSPEAFHTLEVFLKFFQVHDSICFCGFSRVHLGAGRQKARRYTTLTEIGKGLDTRLISQSSWFASEHLLSQKQ